jgi:hypothetical protein
LQKKKLTIKKEEAENKRPAIQLAGLRSAELKTE